MRQTVTLRDSSWRRYLPCPWTQARRGETRTVQWVMVRGFRLRKRAALAPAVVPSAWIPAERFWACAKKKLPEASRVPGGQRTPYRSGSDWTAETRHRALIAIHSSCWPVDNALNWLPCLSSRIAVRRERLQLFSECRLFRPPALPFGVLEWPLHVICTTSYKQTQDPV